MMKDRIEQVQQMTKMSQQEFAKTIGVSPGSLSSVYKERIQPTSNYVIGIHKAFPNINVNWLMFGEGEMYVSSQPEDPSSAPTGVQVDDAEESYAGMEPTSAHASPSSAQPSPTSLFDMPPAEPSGVISFQGMRKPTSPHSAQPHPRTRAVMEQLDAAKNFDVKKREVKEIRVFYDDGTYETFVPSK